MSFGISATTAALIGGGLAAAGSIGGALISSNGAQSAASTEANAANQADQTQLDMYNQTRADHAAYLGAGTSATNQLAYLMGFTPTDPNAGAGETAAQTAAFNPMAGVNTSLGASGSLAKPFSASDFTADPGYQFSVDQGTQALQRSAAAKGGLMSGAALKDLSTYAQGTAAQEYQSVYDRYNTNQNNLYSRLGGITNSGAGAANNVATSGMDTSNAIGNNTTSAGSAIGAGQVASANAIGSGVTSALGNLNIPAWSTGLGGNTINGVASGNSGGGQINTNNIVWN